MKKKFFAIGAAALMATGIATAGAGPASAADCKTNGRLLQSVAINSPQEGRVGTVSLYWSETCGTNWATATFANDYSGTLSVFVSDGRSTQQPIARGWTSAYTSTIYARDDLARGSITLRSSEGYSATGTTASF